MAGKPFPKMLLIAGLILLIPLVPLANEESVTGNYCGGELPRREPRK